MAILKYLIPTAKLDYVVIGFTASKNSKAILEIDNVIYNNYYGYPQKDGYRYLFTGIYNGEVRLYCLSLAGSSTLPVINLFNIKVYVIGE